jgi:hypothetical protein
MTLENGRNIKLFLNSLYVFLNRNFLVGTARPLPENTANDINSYFPDGRLLTIMMVTWNTGEASKLYEQNYTPKARETAEPKERMLNDMSDILLPTFIDFVSDLIIVCTQEMSVAKKRYRLDFLQIKCILINIESIGRFYFKKLLDQLMFYFIRFILVHYHYVYFYEEI